LNDYIRLYRVLEPCLDRPPFTQGFLAGARGRRHHDADGGARLRDIKSKYPDRADLVAILTDESRRNPLTAMPPFGRNRILTEQEINAIVDFLQTL
jgi:mono/diheme cytochrome c family protein